MNHGWEKKRLGDLCAYHRGLTYSKDDEVEKSSKSVLRANNINLETSTLNLDELKYLREDFYIAPKYLLSKDSILICMSSGSKSHLGKVAFIDKDSDYAFGGFMGLIIPKTNARFLYLFMTSPFFRSHLQKITNGININNLKFSTLQDLFVPVPAADVQTKIVTELDRIKALIEIKRNQLKDLDTLAQSLFYDFFGDPITNPKKWQIKKIKEIGKVITGSTPSTKVEDYYNSHDICFVKPGDIDNSISYISDTKDYISNFAFDSCCRKLPMGTVVVTCIGIIGKVGVLKVEANCNQQINAVIPFDAINNIYLAYILKEYAPLFTDAATGPVVKILNKSSFSEFSIPVPPLEIQEKFAERIERIEAQKEAVESTIAELQTLLDSRMDYWFN